MSPLVLLIGSVPGTGRPESIYHQTANQISRPPTIVLTNGVRAQCLFLSAASSAPWVRPIDPLRVVPVRSGTPFQLISIRSGDAIYCRSSEPMQATGKINLMDNGVERIMPLLFLFDSRE